MDNGIPILGQSERPEEVFSRGTIIIACSMDGNRFAWFVHTELAGRISQKDANTLIQQFRDSLRNTAAKSGNVLR